MKKSVIYILLFAFTAFLSVGARAQDTITEPGTPAQTHQEELEAYSLIIPAGQISNQLFKVFVPDADITSKMQPRLFLKTADLEKEQSFEPVIVAPRHVMFIDLEGEKIARTGTLMAFNIKKLKYSRYRANVRVVPQLIWMEKTQQGTKETSIVYDSYYYIGNSLGSFIWTSIIIFVILLIITTILYARNMKEQWLGLISDTNGQVSMALLQMLLWTLAVGYMVMAFGILRLNVPNIPDTLIALMLFAAGTSTAGHLQTKVQLRKEAKLKEELKKRSDPLPQDPPPPKPSVWAKFSTVFYANKDAEYPSMAKVQVLIWTVITLVLFIYLSITEGKLWDVPPELVVLMGISQATFLGRQQMAIQDVNMKIKDAEKPPDENT